MIVTDNEELYHILLCLRSHGWTRHLPEKNKICGAAFLDVKWLIGIIRLFKREVLRLQITVNNVFLG